MVLPHPVGGAGRDCLYSRDPPVRRPTVVWLFANDPRGARYSARRSRRNLVFDGPMRKPDHEAVIRFGGEAPRRGGPILTNGSMTMFKLGSPPPRDRERPAGQDRSSPGGAETLYLRSLTVRLVWSGRLPQHHAVWDLTGGDHASRAR